MTDVFKDLPRLLWRGIEVPIANRRVSFEQEHARHKFAYRDYETIESLGRKNWQFEYTIPFRQDINKGPYKDLYDVTFREFLEACADRNEGDLQDPILGVYTARCVSVNIATDVNRRDGEDVEVVFVNSRPPEGEVALQDVVLRDPAQQAYELQQQLGETALGPIDLPQAVADLNFGIDALDQISGFGAQALAAVNRVDSAFSYFEHKVNKIIDQLETVDEALSAPFNAPVIRGALRLNDSVNRLRLKVLFPGRAIATQVIGQDMTASALAQYLGMSVYEFVLLNPSIVLPLVPAGTMVSYFKDTYFG